MRRSGSPLSPLISGRWRPSLVQESTGVGSFEELPTHEGGSDARDCASIFHRGRSAVVSQLRRLGDRAEGGAQPGPRSHQLDRARQSLDRHAIAATAERWHHQALGTSTSADGPGYPLTLARPLQNRQNLRGDVWMALRAGWIPLASSWGRWLGRSITRVRWLVVWRNTGRDRRPEP